MRPDLLVFLSILALALLSMGVFRALGLHTTEDPLEVPDRGDFVLGAFVRRWFYWVITPLDRLFIALGLSPTVFNVGGVLFGVAAGVAFAGGHLVTGGWCVLLGGVADVFDGRVARARGLASARGAFLDSTLDRFAEVAAFVGLVALFRTHMPGVVLAASALGGSLLVSYARARGESVGVVCKKGVMQRAERLLLVGFGGVLDPSVTRALDVPEGAMLLTIIGLVAAGTVGTAVYRTLWIADRLSE